MWIYVQANGNLYKLIPPMEKPRLEGSGYSGYGPHKNNPGSQCFEDLGPLPRGQWTIGPYQDNTSTTGKVIKNSMRLSPNSGTDTCGRSGFLIHGDDSIGVASAGCIILPLAVREMIGRSKDSALKVVETDPS